MSSHLLASDFTADRVSVSVTDVCAAASGCLRVLRLCGNNYHSLSSCGGGILFGDDRDVRRQLVEDMLVCTSANK